MPTLQTHESGLGTHTYMSGEFENAVFEPKDEATAKWLLLRGLGHTISLHEVIEQSQRPPTSEPVQP